MAEESPRTCDSQHSVGVGDSGVHPTPIIANNLQSPEVQSNPTPTTDANNNILVPPLPPKVRKRKLKSPAWNHFTLITISGEEKAKCNYCSALLGGETRNGSSHLNEHIKRCLRKRGGKVDIRQSILSTSNSTGSIAVTASGFDQELAREALAKAIILHEYPLAMVEHYGFRMFMGVIQPQFKVVSRNTVKSDISKIYDHEMVKTMKLLERNKSRVAITTDMWTASNQKRGFMAVTTHFIDDNWALQSRIMRFIYVPCPHTAEVLSDALMDCLMDWNLDRKVSALTVDNCSTNDSMISFLLRRRNLGTMMLGGDLFHMRCSAHILNLIVKDGLEVIGDGVERIRNSVAYWTATPKREEKFMEAARQLNTGCGKKLALDCKTRWNSTYLMLETALIFKDVFPRLKQRDSQYKWLPRDEDWLLASDICEKLKLFYNATELFSGTKYPTANLFFPTICSIKKSLDQWRDSNYSMVRDMASNMVEKFDKYWTAIHGIMAVATILDPRFKMKLIGYLFPKLYDQDDVEEKIQRVRNLCFDLLSEYMSTGSGASSSSSRVSQAQAYVGQLQSVPVNDVLGDYFVDSMRSSRGAPSSTVKSELDYYLADDIIPPVQNFDILNWWKTNGSKYPTLNRVARDILAVPVSTVASESAFSTGGRFVSPHRNRLHPKTLEALMCAQNWLWADIKDETSTSLYRRSTFEDDADPPEEQSCMLIA